MDHLRERVEALEHHLHTLEQQTRTVTRRLRRWRGLACGLLVLGLLSWTLPASTAQEKHGLPKDLARRVRALESLLIHFSRVDNEVFITGANLRIVNGLGRTECTNEQGKPIPDCPNGLGNLIVGYNEPRGPEFGETIRTGSHNVVVGIFHNFSSVGGLVAGKLNEISGDFASVSGGLNNTASGERASVSGGQDNTASGAQASISGGLGNTASWEMAWVGGGQFNTASSASASVSGGAGNTASGFFASVSGGSANTANGGSASVCGGRFNTASGTSASVSGGESNAASGDVASVSGGRSRGAPGESDWAAGPFFADE